MPFSHTSFAGSAEFSRDGPAVAGSQSIQPKGMLWFSYNGAPLKWYALPPRLPKPPLISASHFLHCLVRSTLFNPVHRARHLPVGVLFDVYNGGTIETPWEIAVHTQVRSTRSLLSCPLLLRLALTHHHDTFTLQDFPLKVLSPCTGPADVERIFLSRLKEATFIKVCASTYTRRLPPFSLSARHGSHNILLPAARHGQS